MGQSSLRMYANPPTLRFTTRAAGRVPVTHRKGVKWLEMGQMLGELPEARQQHCPLSESSSDNHKMVKQALLPW